ncbi:PREDICTED: probable cyclic nucleotide-gated ion channel 5 isoform X3 [Nelumbo nucifera]|uniref:Probable cyclic nucleotide-gated ion channel 5 isoform X3 n=1 Tax=Nelumbo nucifera TaxID=4432 RepID=A0A1U8BEH6_NELNU|nr:PREDICTED: probable cyclic nucleotide-gated ion channel 5 isoform X3 [Nelumbo nucifera]
MKLVFEFEWGGISTGAVGIVASLYIRLASYGDGEIISRLDDMDSRLSLSSDAGVNRCGFNIEGLNCAGSATNTPSGPSHSFRMGMRKGSEGLLSLGRSIRYGVTRAVFPEDLKVSEKKIFDPQDKFLQMWNKLFVISCILAVSVDPLFFYLPVIDKNSNCLGIDKKLAITSTTLRTMVDAFYVIRMFFQFRTAYIAPSSRVFGRGELVIDPAQIAQRYLQRYFVVDFLAVLPIPQIVVWKFLRRSKGSDVLGTKQALLFIVLLQYIPRFTRLVPLTAELKRTAGVFAETAWAGAAYYLLWYMLASHIVGAFWYLLAVERNDACWHKACITNTVGNVTCNTNYLYCGNRHMQGYSEWRQISTDVLNRVCSAEGDDPPFNFGIYTLALTSGIVTSRNFPTKFCFCLWWGLQNLSTLGQGLETSTYPGEVIFSIALAIFGLILFALLIGNMQTYLQSLTIRLEEMRVKRRDSEQWMHHRLLPQELRERVRRYDQYKWLETRGVDEESLVQTLPKDLRRDIKRHLCLALVRRVPLFANMDERLLDAICERLKPSLYTERTYIVREGDPVDEMLFIIRGRLESVTTDGGRSGFFNRSLLKEGDFCGEELLTWALDPKAASNLPSSTRTVKALSEVEAFALIAEELKFVASQFRRLHSRQVQHTFRFYSQQWRTWAASFIQAAWRRYTKRKLAELRRKDEEEFDEGDDWDEEEEEEEEDEGDEVASESTGAGSTRLGATILASRFAANALRGVQKLRNSKSIKELKLQKPPEPDFTVDYA